MQVEHISPPSYARIVSAWMRIGMLLTGIVGGVIFFMTGFAIDMLADIIIPGLGEIMLFVIGAMMLAIVGAGALAGIAIGSIHYAIARHRYEERIRTNL